MTINLQREPPYKSKAGEGETSNRLTQPKRSPSSRPMSKGTFVDLFAGIGGFHYALKKLGYECVLAVEKDPACREIYSKNHEFPADRIAADIRSLTRKDIGDPDTELPKDQIKKLLAEQYGLKGTVDIICGGFPCQPFSKSGRQKGAKDETRGTLFRDIVLLAEALKPRYLILENVRNLAGPKHIHTLDIIRKELKRLGYRVENTPIVLSPHRIKPGLAGTQGGAPQARERVFILAHREHCHGDKHLRELTRIANQIGRSKPHTWSVSTILEKERVGSKYHVKGERRLLNFWNKFVAQFPEARPLPGHPIWTSSFREAPPRTPRWKRQFVQLNNKLYTSNLKLFDSKWLQAVKAFPPSRRKFEWQASQAHPIGSKRTIRDLVIQLRPSGVRVKPATYLPALVAINQTSIIGPDVVGNVDKCYRKITPTEAARLQGIDKIDFCGQADSLSYKQLGNAVNVGVVQLLAKMLTDASVVAELALEYPVDARRSGKKGKRGRT